MNPWTDLRENIIEKNCLYPICSCYDTTGFCEQDECSWPTCDCGVQRPFDDMAKCREKVVRWECKREIGNATLYLGDCLEILPTLPKVDAVITDPPYGQAYKVNTFYKGGVRDSAVLQRNGKTLMVHPNVYPDIHGDDAQFDPAPWLEVAPMVVLWGAHKFADRLPPGGWLVWDKVPTGKRRDQGDGEAAWINRDQPMRIFRLLWDGLCVGKGARHEVTAGQKRYHPAQKPEALIDWTFNEAKAAGLVLDPYMGAGVTGVIAARRGLSFIGIEIEERYFQIACERIENAQRQMRMFA